MASIKGVHFPAADSDLELLNRSETPFHRRLVFNRFFYLMLIMAFRKKVKDKITKPVYIVPRTLEEDLKGFFEFSLTSDQRQAIKEISNDLISGHPMNRMLMGDVGTGKTAVAAIAAHITVLNNRQAALMAPTQILAEQHMDYFSSLPERMGFRPVLVKGNMKKIEREKAYQKIKGMHYNLIIGTQSLIQKDLIFGDLGLAIIDEQHRFGVRQRALMDLKGDNPHMLVMTATPIPRSLAIAIYSDMDLSIIKEYPRGHKPVKTCLIDKARKKWAFEKLKDCVSSGRQAFVICPVIDETEESDLKGAKAMHERLKKILSPPYRTGMVHGRMSTDERERIMQGFHKRDIDLLVATTVVEVGVHVPNATVMIIEHPERFGLAQLHQLRGRVGRGEYEGMCLLILPDNIPEKTQDRLKAIAESHDGFEIAQKDLEFRGHGELSGLRQAGIGEIEPSEVIRHQGMLLDAKRLAHNLIQSDSDLSSPDNRYLKIMMEAISGGYHDL
jgi:ATP-dependent DNA helicase RecG